MMEENPLHSSDVLYGVPSAFKDILTDVIENGIPDKSPQKAQVEENEEKEDLDAPDVPTLTLNKKFTASSNRNKLAGKTFNRRNDLMINMGGEDSIEVREIQDENDQTIDELFKQPGFNRRKSVDAGSMSIDRISFDD